MHAVANTRVSTLSAILFFLLVAVAIVFVACRNDQLPTDTIIIDQPPLEAKSDGADGGNPGFFFLPPLVHNPSGHENFDAEDFDATVRPWVEVCELDAATFEDELPAAESLCHPSADRISFPFGPEGVEVHPDEELYQVEWHTNEYGLNTDSYYRIFAFAQRLGEPEPTQLGFVDVNPVTAREMKSAKTGEVFALKDGRTLPIKFRLELDWICDPGLSDCTVEVIHAADGGVVVLEETGDLVDIPPQDEFVVDDGNGGTTTVDSIKVLVQPCGDPSVLPIDLPQYGNCMDVQTEPPLAEPLSHAATVALCSAEGETFGLTAGEPPQWEYLTVHQWDLDDDVVYALPHAEYACMTGGLDRGDPAGLMKLARTGWHVVGSALELLFGPTPLHANAPLVMHHGPAGPAQTFSWFGLALPATIELEAGDGQAAATGDAVPIVPSVRVRDLRGNPVEDATVRFEIVSGSGSVTPAEQSTGPDGIAAPDSWELGISVGLNLMRAYGRGLADEENSGPREGIIDPFQPLDDVFDELGVVSERVEVLTGDVVLSAGAVEQGGLCEEGDASCTQQVITADQENTVSVDTDGDPATYDDRVYFPIQPDGFPVQGGGGVEYVDRVSVIMRACKDSQDNPTDMPIDIPLYGDCLDVTLAPPLAPSHELTNAAIVSMCSVLDPENPDDFDPFDLDSSAPYLTLHRYDDGEAYALPHAERMCPTSPNPAPGGVMGYARLGLDAIRSGAEMLLPKRLHANKPPMVMHHGPAGPSTVFSWFQMGVPVKIVRESPADRALPAGTPAVTAVRVLDLGDNPVRGATVHFDVTTGSLDQAFDISDESGFAAVTWTTAGDGIATAGGFGIATENSNGSRTEEDLYGPLDPFMPLDDVFDAVPPTDDRLDQPVPLASGVVTFEVTGEVSPLGPNLLLNPSADDGLNYWSNTGSSGTATMPVSGRTVFFVEDDPVDRARFNQTVEIPENQRGKWALLIGYGWTEHIVQESITRHPYLIGFPNAGLSLQGQNLLHTEDENTWQTMWGIFELDAAISTINFQAAQAYQIGDDPDGTRAVFDDLELVIFETQAAAEAYRDLYIVDHPVTYEELSNP